MRKFALINDFRVRRGPILASSERRFRPKTVGDGRAETEPFRATRLCFMRQKLMLWRVELVDPVAQPNPQGPLNYGIGPGSYSTTVYAPSGGWSPKKPTEFQRFYFPAQNPVGESILPV
jgi:hypothetical protein